MSTDGGLVSKWKNPEAFSQYETSRGAVGPALSLAIQEALLYMPAQGDILEIGAGAGALRQYAGEATQDYNWTESDHNPNFLDLSRSNPTRRLVAKLPDIPCEDDSMDAVVGLGVLDTMETQAVEETAARAKSVLRPGGVLLHLMDLAPDLVAEIYNNRARHMFPLPYMANGDIGICYIDARDGTKIQALDIEPALKRVLVALISDPEKYLPMANRTAILPHLGTLAMQHGLAVESHGSWMKHFGNRLSNIATEQGFNILANGFIQKQALQSRSKVPPPLRQANIIYRTYGALRAKADEGIYIPGYVNTVASIHVFAASK